MEKLRGIDETDLEVKFLAFLILRTQGVIPIEEACPNCKFWEGRFSSTDKCVKRQTKDAKARGFTNIVCPEQFKRRDNNE